MAHIVVLIISIIMFFISSPGIPIEVSLIVVVPYVWYLSKEIKNYKGRLLVPPYLLTLYLVFSIVLGALTIKYDLSPMTTLIYGYFNDRELGKCIYISLVGVSACWLSFSSLVNSKKPYIENKDFNIQPATMNNWVKPLVILLLGVLVLLVVSGNFGYYAKNSEASNYTEKIYQFLLLIVTFHYLYESKPHEGFFYIIVVGLISALGLISGSKTLLILPIFTLYVIESVKTHNWTNKYLKMIPILFAAAFLLIIPIRYMIRSEESLSMKQSSELLSDNADGRSMAEMVVTDVVDRVNYVPVLSVALNHRGEVPANVSNLWQYTFMSPVYAFVPRFIYPDKPSNTFSNWYAYNLMGSTEENHMSASYQGILYMNGGILSVIFGFLLVGILFYYLYVYYFQERYIYIYLTQIMTFVVLPAEPWVLYVSTIQNLIVFYILHRIISKKS